MDKVAKSPPEQRLELFSETAAEMGLLPSLVEKDFWVCWSLKRLFTLPEIKDHVLFKGGTSLSKVFGLIDRFSEDIDLTVDRKFLGFGQERALEKLPSRKQKEKRLKEMRKACNDYIAGDLLKVLKQAFKDFLPEGEDWSLEIDPNNPERLIFVYPSKTTASVYVSQSVCFEIGVRGEFYPNDWYQVESYSAKYVKNVFSDPRFKVCALRAERTFWEKATLLHQEHYRDEKKNPPERYARHYYDLFKMAGRKQIQKTALNNLELFNSVVKHKRVYFHSAWARYDLATPSSLQLLPSKAWSEYLKKDFEKMQEMFFKKPPSWDEILNGLGELQKRIRKMEKS